VTPQSTSRWIGRRHDMVRMKLDMYVMGRNEGTSADEGPGLNVITENQIRRSGL